MTRKIEKQIPMIKEFNQKSVNDWVYGYLQSISYVDENKVTFVYPDDVNMTDIAKKHPLIFQAGKNKNESPTFKPANTMKISRDLKKLESLGFIKRGSIKGLDGAIIKNAYILPFNEEELFKFIPLETLEYILKTMSLNCIKIYIYLLNKFQWKIKNNQFYNFTSEELITECLGIKSATNSRDYQTILFVLDALLKFKFIRIEKDFKRINGQLTTQWKLLSVTTKIELEEEVKV